MSKESKVSKTNVSARQVSKKRLQKCSRCGKEVDMVFSVSPTGKMRTKRNCCLMIQSINKTRNNKYELLSRWGYLSGDILSRIGIDIEDIDEMEDYLCNIFSLGNNIVKISKSPWNKVKPLPPTKEEIIYWL